VVFSMYQTLRNIKEVYLVWELYNNAMSESICSFSYLSSSLWIAVMKDKFGEIDNLLGVSSRIGESPGAGLKEGKRRLGMGRGHDISSSDLLRSNSSSGVRLCVLIARPLTIPSV
jgi:hypothetical protein